MYYFQSVKDKNNLVYSCDSIRLEIQLKSISSILEKIAYFCCSNCDGWYQSFKTFNYKYCFTFNLDIHTSFSILVGLNTFGKVKSCFVIDFNPNKCMKFDKFRNIVSFLFCLCENYIKDTVIKRYDLAIDLPYKRELVNIIWNGKGSKRHETVQTTIEDKTDYFGERNTIGRLKVYNKSLEDIRTKSSEEKKLYKSGFYEYLTRVEITHNSFDSIVVYSSLPCVFTRYSLSVLPDCFTEVDYILVNSCLENSEYIPHLKRSKKKWLKLKDYIIGNHVEYSIDCVSEILFQISCYMDISMYSLTSFNNLKEYFSNNSKNRDFDINQLSFEDDILCDDFEEITEDDLKPF